MKIMCVAHGTYDQLQQVVTVNIIMSINKPTIYFFLCHSPNMTSLIYMLNRQHIKPTLGDEQLGIILNFPKKLIRLFKIDSI